jgi:hypothetical protein
MTDRLTPARYRDLKYGAPGFGGECMREKRRIENEVKPLKTKNSAKSLIRQPE